MKKEIFKDVPEIETKYSISNYGKVYSKKNSIYLKHYIDQKNGIHQVKIIDKNENPKTITVLKLMALTFIKNTNPELYCYAININGNPDDLNIDNIMWGTSSIQVRRKYKRHPELKEKFICNSIKINTRKMTDKLETQLFAMRDLGYSVKQLADIFPIKTTQIFNLLKKRNTKTEA